MKTVNTRISSKNQLTLPMALVKKYGLDVSRNVTITDKGGALIIRPEPPLEKRIGKLWQSLPARTFPPLSDEQISAETRATYARHYARKRPTDK